VVTNVIIQKFNCNAVNSSALKTETNEGRKQGFHFQGDKAHLMDSFNLRFGTIEIKY
jgi:hypothetical protein